MDALFVLKTAVRESNEGLSTDLSADEVQNDSLDVDEFRSLDLSSSAIADTKQEMKQEIKQEIKSNGTDNPPENAETQENEKSHTANTGHSYNRKISRVPVQREQISMESILGQETLSLLSNPQDMIRDLEQALPLNMNRFESLHVNLQQMTSRAEEALSKMQKDKRQDSKSRLMAPIVQRNQAKPMSASISKTITDLQRRPAPPLNPRPITPRAQTAPSTTSHFGLHRSGTFLTETDISERPQTGRLHHQEAERDVERVRFPGFDSSGVTPLPFPDELKPILESAGSYTTFSNSKCRTAWNDMMASKNTISIVHDLFWWMFCHTFQHDRVAQEQMFSRIAGNFVAIFLKTDPKWKDELLSKYHEALARSLYKLFVASYTKSPRAFGDEFKQQLCHVIYEWFTGLKPTGDVWKSWDDPPLKSLTDDPSPSHDQRSIMTATRPSSGGSATEDIFDSKLPRIPRVPKLKLNKVESNIIPSDGAQTTGRRQRVMFDLYGHSPLINYHLSKTCRKDVTSQKSFFVYRTEFNNQPPPGKVTYRQFTDRSLNVNRRVYQMYTKARDDLERERIRIRKEGVLEKRYLEKEMKEVMRRHRDLHHYSDQLLHIHQSEGDDVPEVIQDPRPPEERLEATDRKS